ncbi:MAG: hypothetical protein R3324_01635 [Halobacteriales archaeon]|nr:hypothetical protein [Halobacteriales archaeon]
MVGPISDEGRRRGYRTVKMGFVVLVGLSSGLVSLTGDPSLPELGLVVLAGMVVGVILLFVLGL